MNFRHSHPDGRATKRSHSEHGYLRLLALALTDIFGTASSASTASKTGYSVLEAECKSGDFDIAKTFVTVRYFKDAPDAELSLVDVRVDSLSPELELNHCHPPEDYGLQVSTAFGAFGWTT